ncbi:hypothetical protein ACJX0J_030373 [Zea mays]
MFLLCQNNLRGLLDKTTKFGQFFNNIIKTHKISIGSRNVCYSFWRLYDPHDVFGCGGEMRENILAAIVALLLLLYSTFYVVFIHMLDLLEMIGLFLLPHRKNNLWQYSPMLILAHLCIFAV